MINKFLILIFTLATFSFADINPEIGYLYPAGGEKGTVVRVIIGGQKLRQPTCLYFRRGHSRENNRQLPFAQKF